MFKEAPEKIEARTIIEVVGAPKDFVDQTLTSVVALIRTRFKVLDEKIFKAAEREKLFGAFAEIEVEFKSFEHLIGYCYEYMPSSVEIINPLDFNIPAEDLTGIINDLLGRLHDAELNKKASDAQGQLLTNKLGIILKNLVVLALRQGEKSIEEVAECTGVAAGDLETFMRIYISDGTIMQSGSKFKLKEDEGTSQPN